MSEHWRPLRHRLSDESIALIAEQVANRELFARLADEVDAYLTPDDAPLWETP